MSGHCGALGARSRRSRVRTLGPSQWSIGDRPWCHDIDGTSLAGPCLDLGADCRCRMGRGSCHRRPPWERLWMGIRGDQRRPHRRALHSHGVLRPFRQCQAGAGIRGTRHCRSRDVSRFAHWQLGSRADRLQGAGDNLHRVRSGRWQCRVRCRGGDGAALTVTTFARCILRAFEQGNMTKPRCADQRSRCRTSRVRSCRPDVVRWPSRR